MGKYQNRIADRLLEEKLSEKGAILIEGPKWCGKTTTAEHQAKSVLYFADPKNQRRVLILAESDPEALLQGETPRLLDEWQMTPTLWDAVRFAVDHRQAVGQFILTGSAVPADLSSVFHTGTGRITRLKMRTMSLFESGESNGSVSLEELFRSPERISGENKLSLRDICFLICRGGWPSAIHLRGKAALDQAFDYYDAVVNSDISRADNIRRDPERVKRLMRSFARNQGQAVGDATICADMKVNDTESLNVDTVHAYIEALKKIFVVEDSAAWNPNLRSKTAIRTSDTRYFIDSSIATAALGFGPEDLMEDIKTCGFMFETMAVRDLRVYADALGGTVYHYRDKSGLECDAVVHLRNGKYGLIEIKIGGETLIEEGAESLKKLEESIDTAKMKKPSFLMILTANSDAAYRRTDGVYVVPIGCLGV